MYEHSNASLESFLESYSVRTAALIHAFVRAETGRLSPVAHAISSLARGANFAGLVGAAPGLSEYDPKAAHIEGEDPGRRGPDF